MGRAVQYDSGSTVARVEKHRASYDQVHQPTGHDDGLLDRRVAEHVLYRFAGGRNDFILRSANGDCDAALDLNRHLDFAGPSSALLDCERALICVSFVTHALPPAVG